MEQEILTAISTVGFPIVACCALFYLMKEIIAKITGTLDKQSTMMEMQTKSVDKQTETLEKLNATISKLEYRLDSIENKIDNLQAQHVK